MEFKMIVSDIERDIFTSNSFNVTLRPAPDTPDARSTLVQSVRLRVPLDQIAQYSVTKPITVSLAD